MPNPVLHTGAVLGSLVTSTLNQWRGCIVVRAAVQPPLPIVLYDFEACPYCRLVREAITALHLDVEVRPVPHGGTRFRAEAQRLGGKQQFPLLHDTNSGVIMDESREIVEYLFRTYGQRSVPGFYRAGFMRPHVGAVSSAARLFHGARARKSKAPEQPLALWSFEGSPFSRLVRERMTELELPYTLHSLGKEDWREAGPATRRITPNPYVPKEGGKRHAFYRAHGRVQVPYLEDPNTNIKLFESSKIVDYLERTYAL